MNIVAELVNDLFRTHRKPDGREYSNREVVSALGGQVSADALSKIRRGDITNPGRNTLLLLCQFFNVPPSYFFPEWSAAPASEVSETDETAVALARQIAELPPEARVQLAKFLEALRNRRG